MTGKCGCLLVAFCLCALSAGFSAEQAIDSAELKSAAYHQQKSLSFLVASLKDLRKVMLKDGQGQMNQEQNPFDKEKLVRKDSANLEKAIRDALEKQNDVVKAIEKSQKKGESGSGGAAGKIGKAQEQISKALGEILKSSELSQQLDRQLERARESSVMAEKAMVANEAQFARENAGKSRSAMEKALEQLSQERRKKLDDLLRNARQQINNAVRREMDGEGSSQGSAKTASGVAGKIQSHAQDERSNGLDQLAQELQKLSEETSDKADQTAKGNTPGERISVLEQMGGLLDRQRFDNNNPQNQLAESAKKLQELQDELRFMGKNPGSVNPEDFDGLPEESELAMQDVIQQLKNVDKDYQFKAGGNGDKNNKKGGGGYYINKPSQILPQKGNKYYQQLLDDMAQLLADTQKIKRDAPSPPTVMSFSADEVPEEYRNDVADYFKNLSENGANAE